VNDDLNDEQGRETEAIRHPDDGERRLAHFRQWQQAMRLDAAAAAKWATEVRAERRAWRV